MKRLLYLFCLFLIFIGGSYLGVGGLGYTIYQDDLREWASKKPTIDDTIPVIIDSIPFMNRLEMKRNEIAAQQSKFLQYYTWMDSLPDLIIVLITCCAFSMLGSYFAVLWSLVGNRSAFSWFDHILFIATGFLTGLIVLGLSYLLPVVLVKEGKEIRPVALMFLSLFGGIYSKKLYDKLSGYVDNFFETE